LPAMQLCSTTRSARFLTIRFISPWSPFPGLSRAVDQSFCSQQRSKRSTGRSRNGAAA